MAGSVTRQGGSPEVRGSKPEPEPIEQPMSQATQNRRSLLTPAGLRALFEETTEPGGNPHAALLAARSILNLAYVAEERAMTAYHDDPMSAYAPGECADLVARPWRSLRELVDARIAALEAEVDAMESEWFSVVEAV